MGPADDPATAALHRAALLSSVPGLVLALGEPGLRRRSRCWPAAGLVGGEPAAYVCRGFTCEMPVTTAAGLRAELAAGA